MVLMNVCGNETIPVSVAVDHFAFDDFTRPYASLRRPARRRDIGVHLGHDTLHFPGRHARADGIGQQSNASHGRKKTKISQTEPPRQNGLTKQSEHAKADNEQASQKACSHSKAGQ